MTAKKPSKLASRGSARYALLSIVIAMTPPLYPHWSSVFKVGTFRRAGQWLPIDGGTIILPLQDYRLHCPNRMVLCNLLEPQSLPHHSQIVHSCSQYHNPKA